MKLLGIVANALKSVAENIKPKHPAAKMLCEAIRTLNPRLNPRYEVITEDMIKGESRTVARVAFDYRNQTVAIKMTDGHYIGVWRLSLTIGENAWQIPAFRNWATGRVDAAEIADWIFRAIQDHPTDLVNWASRTAATLAAQTLPEPVVVPEVVVLH